MKQPRIVYNAQRLAEDMAAKGWNKLRLAHMASVSDMAVGRFLRGERRTAPMALKLATALGYSVERYLVRGGHK